MLLPRGDPKYTTALFYRYSTIMFRTPLACLIITALIAAPCSAASPAPAPTTQAPAPAASVHIPTAPQVDARSYILVDYRTDKTLAGKDRALSSNWANPCRSKISSWA